MRVMCFRRDVLVVAMLALTAKPAAAESWYPANYATSGGEEICLNDGNHPVWMEDQGLIMTTVTSCCLRYFSYINQLSCVDNSNGITYTGTGDYYPLYQDSKCAQDCDIASGGACGGVLTDTSVPLFSSIGDCCANNMGHIDPDLCAEISNPAGGTNKYYADAQNSLCLRDCEPGTSVGCTRVTSLSTKLYTDLTSCCDSLPWAGEYCNTRSIEQTTNKWFATSSHICRQDCASGATCADLTDPSETLYDTALECCQGKLNFVPGDQCETLSLGDPLAGSSLWYVSYESGNVRCYQDCPSGTGNCGGLADPGVVLFDSSSACCQNKLPHYSLDYCETVSIGLTYTGSLTYYPDYASSICVQDCDSAIAGCGGIITDSSKTLFPTISECCDQSLATIESALCEDRSDVSGTGTGKYYTEPGSLVCFQDSGATRVTDPLTLLFDDAEKCCTEAIPYVSTAYCTSRSSGSYSDKWYVADYSTQKCAKDCASGGTNCVPATDPSTDLYDSALECCTGKLSWMDSAQCEANSSGVPTYTNKFYVSYSDEKCVQDCADTDPAPCGGNPSSDKTLFDDAEDCCTEKLHWKDLNVCVADTNGVSPGGTNLWYVDWVQLKCVQDCDGSAPCGGLKTPYDELYNDSSACCDRLSWIDPTQCVLT